MWAIFQESFSPDLFNYIRLEANGFEDQRRPHKLYQRRRNKEIK